MIANQKKIILTDNYTGEELELCLRAQPKNPNKRKYKELNYYYKQIEFLSKNLPKGFFDSLKWHYKFKKNEKLIMGRLKELLFDWFKPNHKIFNYILEKMAIQDIIRLIRETQLHWIEYDAGTISNIKKNEMVDTIILQGKMSKHQNIDFEKYSQMSHEELDLYYRAYLKDKLTSNLHTLEAQLSGLQKQKQKHYDPIQDIRVSIADVKRQLADLDYNSKEKKGKNGA